MEKGTRTCIACKQKFNKFSTDFIKISYDNEIEINKLNSKGKSCYIHNNNSCIENTIKHKLLNKKFRKNISELEYLKLKNFKG